MARHPTARRVHRESTEPDDVVLARLLQLSQWASKHARALIIAAIVLAIAIFSLVRYLDYRETLAQRAAIELLEVRATANSGNFALATRDLATFLQRFGGTPAALEARMLLAQLHLLQDQPQQAIEVIQPVTDEAEGIMRTSAGLLLAGAYEDAEQPEQALQQYLAVADYAEMDFQRREALEDAARLRVATGDTAGATELYQQLIQITPAGVEQDIYNMRLSELQAAT